MEVITEVPNTGTKLRIDADREFDRQTGDAVLRIFGQSPEGEQVLDAAYVEVNTREADLLADALREARTPMPYTNDALTQEIQAAFSSKLSARDAAQIAQIAHRTRWQGIVGRWAGNEADAERTINELAERFERASAKADTPATGGYTGNGETDKRRSTVGSGASRS
jgi:hypothetical protein